MYIIGRLNAISWEIQPYKPVADKAEEKIRFIV